MDLIKEFLLEANPNPERIGCPDEPTLKLLAEGRLPATSPARLHLASCSECFAEYRGFLGDWQARRIKQKRIVWAIAASLLIASGGSIWEFEHVSHQPIGLSQVANATSPVEVNVDLFQTGTVRGASEEPVELRAVTLPAAIVHLSIVLPVFSDSGRYAVVISEDKAGNQVVAKSAGAANDKAGKVTLRVILDLRDAKAGQYYLATIRGADNGRYYYPLKIN